MSAPSTGRRIAVLTKNRLNPAYEGARIGMSRTGAALGCEVRHYVPEIPDDAEEQRALLGAALADGADGIVIAPAHATALSPRLREAAGRGLPIACFVSRPEDVPVGFFAGSDDRALARRIGERLLAEIGPGEVVAIDGHPGALTAAPRRLGFDDAVAAHPGSRIAARFSGEFQVEPSRRGLAERLPGLPRLAGIMAANDVMALGALAALEEAGRRVPTVGVNAIPEAVAAVAAGRLLATAAFDAMSLASLALQAVVRLLDGEAVPAEVVLPVEIVDATNHARWSLPYAQRPLPGWEVAAANAREIAAP